MSWLLSASSASRNYRQRKEIQAALETKYGIPLSTGEISALSRDFVVYLEALHFARAPELKKAIGQDGGWPMHIDATGENGRGTVLVVYNGWRRWVMGSWKIPTECAEAILPRLHQVADHFGPPCAIMRDLGRAMTDAGDDFVTQRQLTIRVLSCHFHFIKDVGKDMLSAGHDEMRQLLRRFEVRGRLRALARELGRELGPEIGSARLELETWLQQDATGHQLPEGRLGQTTVRALVQWVLDYAKDGTDEGFPFDLPYLDLYNRCTTALRAVEAFLRFPTDDAKVRKTLERLHRLVEPVRSQVPFERVATLLQARARIFNELRGAMRLRLKPQMAPPHAEPQDIEELQDIEKAVANLTASLRARRPARGPAKDIRRAIDIVLTHIDRHGDSLWGHAIDLPHAGGHGARLVDRTNIVLEGFNHEVKHGERRRSGRKVLTQDFEQLPSAALLATNLDKPDYVSLLCGDLDQLGDAFSSLDAVDRRFALPVRLRASAAQEGEAVRASLPIDDLKIVRSVPLRNRVLAAAKSRAPRRQSGKRR